MNNYTVSPKNGRDVTFTCRFCAFQVKVSDLDETKGSRRTQAVKAINQHVKAEHERS